MGRHPFWRGTLLASAFVLAMALGQAVELSAGYEAAVQAAKGGEADRFAAALAVMILPGAFLTSLPGRLKRRVGEHSSLRGCLTGAAGGVALAVGAGAAGGTSLLTGGVMQGSVAGLTFAATAAVCGCVAALLSGGGRSA